MHAKREFYVPPTLFARISMCAIFFFALSRRRPSARSGLIDGSGFARAAESPRTLPAYTEWHRLDLTVRGGAGRASATC